MTHKYAEVSELPSVLEKIVEAKKRRLVNLKEQQPMAHLYELLNLIGVRRTWNRFSESIETSPGGLIAEVKRASPSKGMLATEFNPKDIALSYERGGAAAISVLTEEDYFLGSVDDFKQVKEAVKCPILRKDFIIDPYQIYESAVMGADAILLIACLHDLDTLKSYMGLSYSLGMEVLLEVHDAEDLDKAIKIDAPIIGVNNRNLRTFHVSVENSLNMVKQLPAGKLWVSESGIQSKKDIQDLKSVGFKGFLVGETFMKKPELVKSFCSF